MPVEAVYYSSKDGLEAALKEPQRLMFTSKKEADKRDKVLELASEFQVFFEREVPGIDEDTAERCGIALAENSDRLKRALKNPAALNEPDPSGESGGDSGGGDGPSGESETDTE